jgi:putative Holliday junction resolvase
VSGAHAAIILAFDFGLRRIGIASGNLLTRTASPVTTLHAGRELPWQAIDGVVEQWRPALFVVGRPAPGGADAITAQVERFVAALSARYGLETAMVDEALTSYAAESALRDARREGRRPRKLGERGEIDRHAACLIAEQWMSERHEH